MNSNQLRLVKDSFRNKNLSDIKIVFSPKVIDKINTSSNFKLSEKQKLGGNTGGTIINYEAEVCQTQSPKQSSRKGGWFCGCY